MNPDDRWKPTRRPKGRTGNLTPAQQVLAEDLHVRALSLMAVSEDGLSIREAVELAAFQLGLEGPVVAVEEVPDED